MAARESLGWYLGKRRTFTATFVRFGQKPGWSEEWVKTILVKDLRLADRRRSHFMADHLWMNLTKAFEALDLQEGDVMTFDARVSEYIKGRREEGLSVDFHLTRPTKASKR